jgi:ABC-2 type transport system permease protein
MTLLAIARNAFLESIRQPIFAVLLIVGILAMVLNVNLAAFTLEDDNKLLIDLGLSTLFLAGLLLAAFTATGVLTREIENKTVLTVVSKPVPRAAVVAGKYLGVAGAITLAYWVLAVVFLLAVRHRVQAGVRMDETFDLPVLVFSLLFGGGPRSWRRRPTISIAGRSPACSPPAWRSGSRSPWAWSGASTASGPFRARRQTSTRN